MGESPANAGLFSLLGRAAWRRWVHLCTTATTCTHAGDEYPANRASGCMSLYYDAARGRWVVQWTDEGKRRSRRFADEADAQMFADSVGAAGRRSLSEPGG